MAKVKLVKAKTTMNKRNLKRIALNLLIGLNSLATVYILLHMYGVIDLVK